MGTPPALDRPVILFDGVCNLCNQSVLFVIKHDARSKFRFAALQSTLAQKVLVGKGLQSAEMNSVVLVKGPNIYTRSRAALEIVRNLDGGWPILYLFMAVPPFLRNAVYDFIARNRYKWFGQKEACMIPTPELRERFID